MCNFIYLSNANTATITASSCSQADVEVAISSASNGDIVIVPSGTCTWSTRVIVNKEITIQGQTTGCPDACVDNTVIKDYGFRIEADNVRITGFTFEGSDLLLFFHANKNNYRIDHNRIKGWARVARWSSGKNYGLFDHNIFENCKGEALYILGDSNQSWADGGSGGGYTDGTVYIEDNIFDITSGNGSNAVDSGAGARWVFRYNTVNETGGFYGVVLASHGHFWGERDGPDNAGTYIQEVYGNTFNSGTARNWGGTFRSRGGRVLFYDNTHTGPYWNDAGGMTFWNKESISSGGECSVEDHCEVLGHGKIWEGLCKDWPSPLQTNNSYIWGNSTNFKVNINDGGKNHIVEDRDYWDDVGAGDTNFNTGTSRPATCTVGDVYWETDTKKLYRCTSTDTWTFIYEPYPYPHPLTLLDPPQDLNIGE